MSRVTRADDPFPVQVNGEVPDGWAGATLGDLVRPSSEKVEPQDAPKSRYLSLEHVESGTHRILGSGLGSDVGSTKAVFHRGDVLYGKLRPYLNKVCIPDFDGICSTDFLVFRPSLALDQRLLLHFLSQPEVVEYANHHSSGVQLPRVNFEKLAELRVPVPPLAEQERVVAKVEDLLGHANAVRERLARVPAILKALRQALLGAACDGRLTAQWREVHSTTGIEASLGALAPRVGSRPRRGVPESVDTPEVIGSLEVPEGWGAFSVAQLLRQGALLDVKDGNHGANHPKVADFTATGLPFITAAQVRGFQIDYEGAYKVSGKPLKKLRVGFAKPGDAVLTHKGSVGRSALNNRECVLTPQTTYYRPNVEVFNPGYLVFLFAAPQFYSQLAQVMSQTTRDFVPISEQYRLFLILPPKEEQDEIVRRVEGFFKVADAIEKGVTTAADRADNLLQSIVARAFRGELVPTEAEVARREGRAYEPAAALLGRIDITRPIKGVTPLDRRNSRMSSRTMARRRQTERGS